MELTMRGIKKEVYTHKDLNLEAAQMANIKRRDIRFIIKSFMSELRYSDTTLDMQVTDFIEYLEEHGVELIFTAN